jgi:hypothetical protein
MTSLPAVTLCCIDTRFPDLGFSAILKSTEKIEFGEVLFITNDNFIVPNNDIPRLRIVRTKAISNVDEYSTFMIKGLNDHISTAHCLIVQWDGFVIHPENWDDNYLDYDYIGAPWRTEEGDVVGNGGFSLRSKRLLRALSSDEVTPHHPEDDCICITNRKLLEDRWGISFPPVDVARKFSFEFSDYDQSQFGFHGFSNFPDVLDRKELLLFIEHMPDALFVNEYFIVFCRKIFALNDNELISKISARLGSSLGDPARKSYNKKQISFLVESLINLRLYKSAFGILLNRGILSNWKSTYLKLIIRRFTGSS